MKWIIKPISGLVIIFLMLICFGLSMGYNQQLKSMKNIVMLYSDDHGLKASELSIMQSKESERDVPVSFSGWVQKNEQDLYNPEFNRHTQVDVVYISGDSSLIIDSSISLKLDDKEGCLISKNSAYELFGSFDVKNNKVLVGDRVFIIRGLIDHAKSTLVIQTLNNDELKMRAVAIETDHLIQDKREQSITQFIQYHNLEVKRVDYNLFKKVANLLSSLFPILLTFICVFSILKRAILARNTPFICALYLMGAATVGVITIVICEVHLDIPQSMIPNLWSDFEFWERMLVRNYEDIRLVYFMLKEVPEMRYHGPMIKTMGTSLLLWILLFISNKVLRIDTSIKIMMLLLFSFLTEFVIIILLYSKGLWFGNMGMFWLMYPYYLIVRYVITRINRLFVI